VWSEVTVRYAHGSVFREMPSTAAAHIRRGTVIDRPYIGRASTALLAANRFLVAHSHERDRIVCTMRSVPAEFAGLVRAGQRISVQFSHEPGYETFVWMRIVACNPGPESDIGDLYDIDLELVSPRVTTPAALYAELNWHHGGFYGCQPVSNYEDGAEIIGWECTGDVPHAGIFYVHPTTGAAEFVPYPVSGACVYLGIRITADATVDIESVGRFGGVSGGTSTSITVHVRQNGTIIGSHTETDPNPGIHAWGGIITINLTDIAVLAEDVFTVSVTFTNWVDFDFYAAIPADGYAQSHFFVSGTGAWGGTLPGAELPVPGGTHSDTRDPTVDDDSDAGYIVGAHWVNTVTGEEFVLVDDTPGAAVWLSTTAGDIIGGVTVTGTPEADDIIIASGPADAAWLPHPTHDHGTLSGLADDDHTQYLLRAEIRRSADKVAGLTPTGYSTSGQTWTDLANATDGNIATYAQLNSGVLGAGTYYAGFQFDLATRKALSLFTLRIGLGGPISSSNMWGYTVRVRYSDDGSSWTTLDTITPAWVLYSTAGGGLYIAQCAHVSTAARYWEVALVKVVPSLSYEAGVRVYDCQWQEDTSDQHALRSDSHRDVATTAPTTGQALVWNGTAWAPGTAGAGRTFPYFGG